MKKKAASFSLTDEELERVEKRMAEHGILNRAEYLLLLHEADVALGFRPTFNTAWQKILRPAGTGTVYPHTEHDQAMVAEPSQKKAAPQRQSRAGAA